MTISIVGTGYVGLTSGALLASAGHKVYCIDVDKKKLDIIKSGKAPFFEPGLDLFVEEGIKSKKLIPTLSYEEAIPESDIAIICVGTPSDEAGNVNLDYIFQAAESIAKHMSDNLIIVQKSTVPVGTGRKIETILAKTGRKSSVVSCPEFLSESSAVFDTLNMDRFVVGGDDEASKLKVIELFKSLDDLSTKIDMKSLSTFSNTYRKKVELFSNKQPFNERVLSIGLESAEMVKVTANAYLSMKITFANAISNICDKNGADINEVMDGIGRDPRIGRDFLYAGIGWGGGCFPKDCKGLLGYSRSVGFDFDLLEQVLKSNEDHIKYSATRIKDLLGKNAKSKKIGVLGLSFKPGTSDTRQSPSISLVTELLELGFINIVVNDPEAINEAKKEFVYQNISTDNVVFTENIEDVFLDSDLVILATEWPEYKKLDFKKLGQTMHVKTIFDGRNVLDKKTLNKIGFNYHGVGR